MSEPSASPEPTPTGDHTPAEALRLLTSDLRDERERRQLPLGLVHERTRISMEVLQQFEETGLVESKMFNQVYLRSLVRSYAFAVGLPAKALSEVFDRAAEGQYDPDWIERAAASVDVELSKRLRREADEERKRLKEEGERVKKEEAERRARLEAEERDEADKLRQEEELQRLTAERERADAQRAEEASRAAAASGAAWERQSGRGDPSESKPPRTPRRTSSTSSIPWAVVGAVVAVLLVVGGAAYWWTTRDAGSDPNPGLVQAQEQTPDDSVVTAPPPPDPSTIDLPDRFELLVTADGAPIQNLKIQADDEVRRPYWIEMGDTRGEDEFIFTEQVTLCLSDACQPLPDYVVLTVAGVQVPNTPGGSTVIDRDRMRELLAAQQAQPTPAL
jgi:hypothetical protein